MRDVLFKVPETITEMELLLQKTLNAVVATIKSNDESSISIKSV